MANRLPGWARARTRPDSIYQLMTNPIAEHCDEMYKDLFQIRDNYFVPSTDVNAGGFSNILQLPFSFEFERPGDRAAGSGQTTWLAPDITGVVDSLSIVVIALDSWLASDKNYQAPTRLTAVQVASSISDTLLAPTYLSDLATADIASINAALTKLPSKLLCGVDGGEIFGGETTDGTILSPKVVIEGQPLEFDYLDRKLEHISFTTNKELLSKNVWDAVWSLETRGIFNPETTQLSINRGFNKDFIFEPYALWVDDITENILMYELANTSIRPGDPAAASIRFVVPEHTSELQRQGFSSRTIVHEQLLLSQGSTVTGVVAIARQPFSPWLVAISQSHLHFFDARQTATIDAASEQQAMLSKYLVHHRGVSPELIIESDKITVHASEGDFANGVNIYTRHQGSGHTIIKTRLHSYVVNEGTLEPTTTYFGWDGVTIDILTDPNQGWIFNDLADGTPASWLEKNVTMPVDLDTGGHVVYVLETQLSGGNLQEDAIYIHSPAATATESVSLPTGMVNKVSGMTFDGQGELLVLLTDRTVQQLNLFYDYATVDYRRNIIFMRETYDQVRVEASPESFADWGSPPAGGADYHKLIVTPVWPTYGGGVYTMTAYYGSLPPNGRGDGYVRNITGLSPTTMYVPISQHQEELVLWVFEGDAENATALGWYGGATPPTVIDVSAPGTTSISVLVTPSSGP